MIPATKDPVTLLQWAKSTDLEKEDSAELFMLLSLADGRIDWTEGKYHDSQVNQAWIGLWRLLVGSSVQEPQAVLF